MNREEAKAWLEHHFDPLPDGTKQSEAVSLAIKVLEQQDVLDKIRAEIGRFAYAHCFGDDIKVCDVFKIIDKYRAESEE